MAVKVYVSLMIEFVQACMQRAVYKLLDLEQPDMVNAACCLRNPRLWAILMLYPQGNRHTHQVLALRPQKVLNELHVDLDVRHGDFVVVEVVMCSLVEYLSHAARNHTDRLRLCVAQGVGLACSCLSICHDSSIETLHHIFNYIPYTRLINITL